MNRRRFCLQKGGSQEHIPFLAEKGHLNKRAGVRTPWTPPGSAPELKLISSPGYRLAYTYRGLAEYCDDHVRVYCMCICRSTRQHVSGTIWLHVRSSAYFWACHQTMARGSVLLMATKVLRSPRIFL